MEKIDTIKCPFPDCGKGFIEENAAKFLGEKVDKVEANQKEYIDIAKRYFEVREHAAGIDKDIAYIKEDIREISKRISEFFQILNTKPDHADIIPKENLVTKGDVGKAIAIFAGILSIINVVTILTVKYMGLIHTK